MPLIEKSTYRPDWLYRRAHAATILPTLLRRVPAEACARERMSTADGDFIDLDCWWRDGAERPGSGHPTVVLCHGLEGNARRQYMLGMARAFGRRGWNVVGYNYRGCSGEPNRQPWSYHSGATGDLREVLEHVQRPDRPVRALVGFSLGGNLILKYLGEDPDRVLPSVAAAVAFSAPVQLEASARELARLGNLAYSRRFLVRLAAKMRAKAALFPDQVDIRRLSEVRTLQDFDELFTAPLSGFAGAADYYRRCSARQFLPGIRVPSLLVNALDDPFLGPECYPHQEARASGSFHLETPRHGGHVGFRAPGGEYWSERRAVEFVTALAAQPSRWA